jgi:hypothetical protein
MLELIYDDKSNIFKLKLDRVNKQLFEASAKTKHEYIKTGWNRLFDQGKERVQDLITSKMTEEEFVKCISMWMASRFGYSLKEVIKS